MSIPSGPLKLLLKDNTMPTANKKKKTILIIIISFATITLAGFSLLTLSHSICTTYNHLGRYAPFKWQSAYGFTWNVQCQQAKSSYCMTF